jgi:hypothetical protein
MAKGEKRTKSGESRRISPPESIQKTYGDGLVNRAIAADILGISVTELRRRDSDKIYSYVTDEKGVHWYDETALRRAAGRPEEAVTETKKKTLTKGIQSLGRVYTKEDAAKVFRELERGVSLARIVQDQDVHPETAMAIEEAYARVTGAVLLSKGMLERIGKLPLRGQWPPQNEKQFEAIIEASFNPSRCARCKERPARLCGTCAGNQADRDANGATVQR